jgi:hypothetical protein
MGITGTAIIYLLLGAVVAIAALLKDRGPADSTRIGGFLLALIFWPILLPFFLAHPSASGTRSTPRAGPRTETEQRIDAVEESLLGALSRLEGVAEDVLAPEVERIRGLAVALHGMARRLLEMDRLLETPELSTSRAEGLARELVAKGVSADDPRCESIRARLKNIERLAQMRGRLSEDLERALFKMEEMSTQMVVLNFAGRPEAEIVRRIKEIAASVEAVAEGLIEAA